MCGQYEHIFRDLPLDLFDWVRIRLDRNHGTFGEIFGSTLSPDTRSFRSGQEMQAWSGECSDPLMSRHSCKVGNPGEPLERGKERFAPVAAQSFSISSGMAWKRSAPKP